MNGRAKALQQLDLMFCEFIKLDAGLKKGTGKAVKSARAGVDPAVLVGSKIFGGDWRLNCEIILANLSSEWHSVKF